MSRCPSEQRTSCPLTASCAGPSRTAGLLFWASSAGSAASTSMREAASSCAPDKADGRRSYSQARAHVTSHTFSASLTGPQAIRA